MKIITLRILQLYATNVQSLIPASGQKVIAQHFIEVCVVGVIVFALLLIHEIGDTPYIKARDG